MKPSGPEWVFGENMELVVSNYYAARGWLVMPLRLIENGGAPRAVGLAKSFVLPDLQVARGGVVRWVEVKGKGRIVKYQKAREFRTGIEERLWNDYLHIETESGVPGYLAMVHLRRDPEGSIDPLLLLAPFALLVPPDQEGVVKPVYDNKPMVFWNVDRFDRFDLPAHDLADMPSIEPRTLHPWEKNSILPPKRPTQNRLL